MEDLRSKNSKPEESKSGFAKRNEKWLIIDNSEETLFQVSGFLRAYFARNNRIVDINVAPTFAKGRDIITSNPSEVGINILSDLFVTTSQGDEKNLQIIIKEMIPEIAFLKTNSSEILIMAQFPSYQWFSEKKVLHEGYLAKLSTDLKRTPELYEHNLNRLEEILQSCSVFDAKIPLTDKVISFIYGLIESCGIPQDHVIDKFSKDQTFQHLLYSVLNTLPHD